MSIFGRRVSIRLVAGLAAAMIVGALLPVMTTAPAREITLVVRDMAFYLDGDFAHPNPVIEVAAGEHVRIVLRNEERGTEHDFAVPAVGVASDLLHWRERDVVSFEVPDTPGAYEYVCTPHRLMMRGTLRVS